MAFSRIQSAQLTGLGAQGVSVEVDITRGLYLFQIVGLPDKAVEESRERVISALRNSLDINPKSETEKVTVSLSPAELKKEGAYFDLAIAVGYLQSKEIVTGDTSKKLFIGELSLNGDVQAVRGLLSIAEWARKNSFTEIFIPEKNETEATLIDGVVFYLVPTLSDLVVHLNGGTALHASTFVPFSSSAHEGSRIDFGDVRGQASAKRALTIAASGGHNIVLYGPPGTGKTMLARAFHGILPEPDTETFLDVARIYSSIGLIDDAIASPVPLRSPHHSASHVAIIGGGQQLRPGDITLAHRGVLYMDEFPEFERRVIEALREPLEEGHITVARAKGSVRYPADFILLAAMNPCPCGYRGSSVKSCTCTGVELARYQKKISGPLVDRIDLWVPVQHVEYDTLHEKNTEKESEDIRKKVSTVQLLQKKRNGKLSKHLSTNDLQESNWLTKEARQILKSFAERIKLSPRVYLKMIKVARTIADLEGSDLIREPHILEALQYRPKLD